MTGLPGREERGLMISLAVWIQYTNVTSGRTDTGRQLVPRLHIASRCKKTDRSIRQTVSYVHCQSREITEIVFVTFSIELSQVTKFDNCCPD